MFFCLRFDFTLIFFATYFFVIGMESAENTRENVLSFETYAAGTTPQRVSKFSNSDGPSPNELCHSKEVENSAGDAHQACKDHCLLLSDAVKEINECYGDSSNVKSLSTCANFEDGKCEKRHAFGYQCKCVQKGSKANISAFRCRLDIRKSKVFVALKPSCKNLDLRIKYKLKWQIEWKGVDTVNKGRFPELFPRGFHHGHFDGHASSFDHGGCFGPSSPEKLQPHQSGYYDQASKEVWRNGKRVRKYGSRKSKKYGRSKSKSWWRSCFG